MADVTHRHAAVAQIGLSVLFIGGYFWLIFLFVEGHVKTPDGWKEALMALIGVLTAGVVQILGYWFSRQRASVAGPEEGEK